ncbi:hypothetical protein NDU88_004441 [Pleurodeles waltl]|uniref:Uncharacterized protein n=1 Tax=Pleurodeles waltl TaxID=8319 RepID=A0AAV7M879_PLEWA|nr:hypothetical protein NDU88_004441 [Pleurodeles waltl]
MSDEPFRFQPAQQTPSDALRERIFLRCSNQRYPWGNRGSGFFDPDAVLSGTNWNHLLGDEGVCKPLLNVARKRPGEAGATETRKEAVAAGERAAGPEATTVENPEAVDRGETLRDVGRAVQIPASPADTEQCSTTVDFPLLQQPGGQEAANCKTRPHSWQSVAMAGAS